MLSTNVFLPILFTLVLLIIQVLFGFLMKRHRKVFLEYHRVLGVVIFLVALINVISFPLVLAIGVVTLIAIGFQIVIGFLLVKNKSLKKYHKPLGISILILIIANLVLLFV